MRSLVAAAEAARLDAAIQADCALPPLLLMENAAVRLWAALSSRPELALRPGAPPAEEPLLVALAGGGNNGGDALAVLRQARFAGRRRLAAVLAADSPGEAAALQLASLLAMGIRLVSWAGARAEAKGLIAGADLLLDGLAGTGLRGPLRGAVAELAAFAAASGRPVAALDLPSGAGDGMEAGRLVLPARLTLSIEPRKLALYAPAFREASGEILAIEGVFPADAVLRPAATLLEDGDLPRLAPRPAAGAHKGERGRLAVFAGEIGALGAAGFAVRAAQAASAGLVGLYARPGLFDRISGDPRALGGAVVREEAALAEGLAA
ncbi:MAG: hypothetical protein JNG85_17705, partial [Spirochaetaceae bacterium]|nr:hypothetical protein [Spirochaetaceae bacterium]